MVTFVLNFDVDHSLHILDRVLRSLVEELGRQLEAVLDGGLLVTAVLRRGLRACFLALFLLEWARRSVAVIVFEQISLGNVF